MGLFKTRLKCEGAKNNQCVSWECKSRRGEEERYRNPDINVAAARRDQIGDWDLGELGGGFGQGFGLVWCLWVFHGTPPLLVTGPPNF